MSFARDVKQATAWVVALRDARKLVERGWCQNAQYRAASGDVQPDHQAEWDRCCLVGALRHAAWRSHGAVVDDDLATLVRAEIDGWEGFREDMVEASYVLEDWNDELSRDKEDVLALLDRAIETAENMAASHPNVEDDVAR